MSQLPSTIEAAAIRQTGGFEVLEKLTLPFPNVQPGDIVIKIQYMGVNFIDTYYRKGLYPVKQFPAVLGSEASGTIVALPTDPEILNDPVFKRRNYAIGAKVVVDILGVHASYISIPWISVYPIPSAMSLREAAAAAVQLFTTLTFFEDAYKVEKDDTILIHTIAGGLGLMMCQLAKFRGTTVIGTTSTKEKAQLAKEHGADHVILYTSENTVERVLEITNGQGVHAVYDGVGKDTFDSNFKVLRRKGTLVSVGNASGAVPPFEPIRLMEKNIKLVRPTMANYLVTPDEVHHYGLMINDLVKKHAFRINIYKDYPFTTEGIQQAQKDLTGGKTIGKLLIKVADD